MVGDLNREASELWNSLKPIIDKEIDARTQGMVQRRKAKVTTAPSLLTGTIGVTEPFGSEMMLPFATNVGNASVGDAVWVEFMYGASNAFVSMFASADKKDFDVLGNLAVGGSISTGGIPLLPFLTAGEEIPANADLHDYTTAGVYYASSTVASTLSNSDITTVPFKLIVMPNVSNTLWQIEIAAYSNCVIALQYYNGSTWGGWKRLTPE